MCWKFVTFMSLFILWTVGLTSVVRPEEQPNVVELRLEKDGVRIGIFDGYFAAPYVIQPGDTLQSISEQAYKTPKYAELLANANKLSMGANLTPGNSLLIIVTDFALKFKPEKAVDQIKNIESFIKAAGAEFRYEYTWTDVDLALTLDSEKGTYTKFNPKNLVLSVLGNKELQVTFSFIQQPLLKIFEGKTEIEEIRITGMKMRQEDYKEKKIGKEKTHREAIQKRVESADYHYERGHYETALDYLKNALAIAYLDADRYSQATIFSTIGKVYNALGKNKEAIEYHRLALETTKALEGSPNEAGILINLGNAYLNIGEYKEALNCYQEALVASRKVGEAYNESVALMQIGNVYSDLGLYIDSQNYYEDALKVAQTLKDKSAEALILGNMGDLCIQTERLSESLNYSKRSLDLLLKWGALVDAAQVRANIGSFYLMSERYSEALREYKLAFEVFEKVKRLDRQAIVLTNIGSIYTKLGQYTDAIPILQNAIKLSESIGTLETVWSASRAVGFALWKSGKPEEAVASYEKAVEAIEQIYASTTGLKEEERTSMIGEKSFVYQEFIELLLELHRKDPNKGYDKRAFIVAEKAKSRTFQELMAKAGAKIVFAGDETFTKMVEKDQQLIAEITSLRTLLIKEFSKPEKEQNQEVITSLKEQAAKAGQSLNELEKEIEVKYPRYADLKKPKPLTVEELQEVLKPDETMISYAVGKDKIAGFVIGKKSFKLVEINIGKEQIVKLVKDFRTGLENVMSLKDLEEFDPKASYKLYQVLFQPLSDELKGTTALYISEDDILYTLPFEALVDKEIDIKTFRQARSKGRKGEGPYLGEYATLHYLLDTYTITYLPSASVLRSLRKYEKIGYGKWTTPLIAFADPIFSDKEGEAHTKGIQGKGMNPETQLMAQLLTRSTGSEKLDRLKESAQEAEAIAEEIKGKKEDIYLREKASEDNVYKINLKDSRYILFSTHGLLGGDFSGVAEPALALTLINNPPKRDGFLTMSEVLGLDLNSELIILSACNTSGKGDKVGSGEGFVGLTRSFMYAGSKSLLVTHWSVESVSARDLMVNTMKLIKDKKARPVALREAKLQMKGSSREDSKTQQRFSLSHPFFWAPFVLVGEGR